MIKPIVTWIKSKVATVLCIITISSTLLAQQTRADTIGDITTIITHMTCETQNPNDMINVGSYKFSSTMLHSEFANTCIPQPYSSAGMSQLLNPLAFLYLAGVQTLNINNEKLFSQNCARANRAVPYDAAKNPSGPKIPFAFCNDVLLRVVLIEASTVAAVNAAAAVISGGNVWAAIDNALTLDPTTYNLGTNLDSISAIGDGYSVGHGSDGSAWGIAGSLSIPINVIQDNDSICVATVGITGWLSMGCKYISEPLPESQYANFMDSSAASNSYTQCSGMGSCYTDTNKNSQAMLTISGPLIGCVRAMINQFLNSPTVCGATGNTVSTFFQFQLNMQRTITALLTIYIILFGFKLVLGASDIKQADIIMFFVKFIAVVYFAVGINMSSAANPNGQQGFDGMTQWVFPIVFSGANEFSSWIMNASPSGLCQFTTNAADATPAAPLNIEVSNATGLPTTLGRTSTQLNISSTTTSSTGSYATGYEWLALWDALDCRVAHYLGLDSMGDAASLANQGNPSKSDSFNFSIPPYFFLLIPAVLTGDVPLAMLAITYPVLVISVAAYMVNAFVVCIISITILGVLAPLFVPLALFNFTKGYFDSWVKLLLSFALQPMVVATFMITLFTIYDAGFYGTCQYTKFQIPQAYAGGETLTKTVFVINSNPSAYTLNVSEGIDDWQSCQKSLGYMINSIFAVAGNVPSLVTSVGTSVSYGQSYSALSAQYPILSAVTDEVGLFFTSPTLALQAIKNFMLSILTACFCLYLMYQMSSQISEFAVDMVEGVSIGGAAIKPRAIMSKVQAGAQKLEDKLNERKVKPKDEDDKSKSRSGDSARAGRDSSTPRSQDSSSSSQTPASEGGDAPKP